MHAGHHVCSSTCCRTTKRVRNGVLISVTSPGFSDMSTAGASFFPPQESQPQPTTGFHSNCTTIFSMNDSNTFSETAAPGHALRPAPNCIIFIVSGSSPPLLTLGIPRMEDPFSTFKEPLRAEHVWVSPQLGVAANLGHAIVHYGALGYDV